MNAFNAIVKNIAQTENNSFMELAKEEKLNKQDFYQVLKRYDWNNKLIYVALPTFQNDIVDQNYIARLGIRYICDYFEAICDFAESKLNNNATKAPKEVKSLFELYADKAVKVTINMESGYKHFDDFIETMYIVEENKKSYADIISKIISDMYKVFDNVVDEHKPEKTCLDVKAYKEEFEERLKILAHEDKISLEEERKKLKNKLKSSKEKVDKAVKENN